MAYFKQLVVVLSILLVGGATTYAQAQADVKPAAKGTEGFLLSWPDEEGWEQANSQENEDMVVIEVIRKGETLDNWSQLGTMIAYKHTHVEDISTVPKIYLDRYKATCPDARLTVHLVENNGEFPRTIFSFDCPKFVMDGKPESSVFVAMQGKRTLYVTSRAINEGTVPEKLRKEWIEWLKTGEVIVE